MPTLDPLFLEQDVWLKLTPLGYEYTRRPEYGVTFINIEVEIDANTLDDWQIAEIRVEKGDSTSVLPTFEVMPSRMFDPLRRFLCNEFHEELQSHVDVNLMPASLAENSDRVYDERHS